MLKDEPWEEFLGGPTGDLCGLCGQDGIIDTRGKIHTPAGVECGVRRFCICPNGRAMKEQSSGARPRVPGVSVTAETYEALKHRARRQGTSISYTLDRLLIGALAQRDKGGTDA